MKVKNTISKSRLLAFKTDKLLVLEKIGDKKKYSLAGGIKKKKESDLDSLIRETSEEINVHLNKEDLTYFITRKRVNKDKVEVSKHYFVTSLKLDEIKILEDHKFKSASWVYWYDALDYLDKDDRFVVELYFGQFNKKVN
ncbi:NUDIX domain-containing protein [Seonamhaeicola marinus]|uniref:NUDIX hydrolase n=1 Tax=Seonamhaeicola marinus TaxID=1912246 RepID=A0A5D0HWM1_9FLAO|nr:NUDIX hydrolase [Seonamhaeicola marinus]TYA74919.1 NUDIX hydrolase [Seonamhaeicola marinus]